VEGGGRTGGSAVGNEVCDPSNPRRGLQVGKAILPLVVLECPLCNVRAGACIILAIVRQHKDRVKSQKEEDLIGVARHDDSHPIYTIA
jgi:hypothetical protein